MLHKVWIYRTCCMDQQALGSADRAFRSDVNFLMYFPALFILCGDLSDSAPLDEHRVRALETGSR